MTLSQQCVRLIVCCHHLSHCEEPRLCLGNGVHCVCLRIRDTVVLFTLTDRMPSYDVVWACAAFTHDVFALRLGVFTFMYSIYVHVCMCLHLCAITFGSRPMLPWLLLIVGVCFCRELAGRGGGLIRSQLRD